MTKDQSTTTQNAAEGKDQSTMTQNAAEDDYLAGADFGEEGEEITDDNAPEGGEQQAADNSSEDKGDGEGKDEEGSADAEDKLVPQSKVKKRLDALTFEKAEEQRKREAIERELADTKKKLETLSSTETVVPPMPDVLDPNYDAKVAERDRLRDKKAKEDAEREFVQKQQADAQAAKVLADQQALQANVNKMFADGKELGFSQEDMLEADGKVAQFITDTTVAHYLLSRDDSAAVIKYLASVPQELDKISRMSAVEASAHIAAVVAPEAGKLKPKATTTPDPLKIPKGKAGGEKKSPYLEGVVFE